MQGEERTGTEECVIWGGINVDKETASFSVASLSNYVH